MPQVGPQRVCFSPAHATVSWGGGRAWRGLEKETSWAPAHLCPQLAVRPWTSHVIFLTLVSSMITYKMWGFETLPVKPGSFGGTALGSGRMSSFPSSVLHPGLPEGFIWTVGSEALKFWKTI